jgi:hypothetical protein
VSEIRNDDDTAVWVEARNSTGQLLLLDERTPTIVFVREPDPGDEAGGRIRLDPGQTMVITRAVSYYVRIVTDRRADGAVYARSLRPGEIDDGRRVHVRPGENLVFEAGSVSVRLDELDAFYRGVDPERPEGSIGAVVRVWLALGATEPRELGLIAQAAAHRLDAATHLVRRAITLGAAIRAEDAPGGPRIVVLIDEYIHLVQEAIVAAARGAALLEHARSLVTFEVPGQTLLDSHRAALKSLRDAYEHIDERAYGRARKVQDAALLEIFDHHSLVWNGVISYSGHTLDVVVLSDIIEACRTTIKDLLGGPPNGSNT